MHFNKLVYFAIRYVKDYDTAREIVQEAFIALWEKRESIDMEKSVKSYLSTSVRNKSLNYLRDNKKYQNSLIEAEGLENIEGEEESNSLENDELQGKINRAMEGLPGKCKQVFLLNRMENMKYQQIADHLKISVKTVEAQMSKALKHMRKELSDYVKLLIIILSLLN